MRPSSRRRRRPFDLRRDLWRVVGVLGLALAVNVGFYLFFNLPRLTALGSLRAARDGTHANLKSMQRRCETMKGLTSDYDDQSVRLEGFFTQRVGTQAERMTSVQKEIRAIAAQFRIDPASIDYQPAEVRDSDLTRFQITLPLIGGYANLRQFISRVERSENLLIVDSIELAGAREGGAMLSLSIKIATFFRTPSSHRLRGPASAAGR